MMCNVKGVAHSDDPTINGELTLQLFSVFQLNVLQIHRFGSVSPLSSVSFPAAAGSCFKLISFDKLTVHSLTVVHYLPSIKWQIDKVSG